MLNPAFSREFVQSADERYQLPEAAIAHVRGRNQAIDTGEELRIQRVFGDELWHKLKAIGLNRFAWQNKSVLDICCGTGFLSYHLLQRISPAKLVLLDISPEEVREASRLITGLDSGVRIEYQIGDALASGIPDATFDVIIGNSFLHHFHDVPKALEEFNRLLKPGGVFVSLHEPTGAALPLEAGSFRLFVKYLVMGSLYIESMRYQGQGIEPQGGTDVWIFRESDVRKLAREAGFVDIRTHSWNLLRPIVVAKKALHLGVSKQQLTRKEMLQLRAAIATDAILSKCLPQVLFGSVSIAAQKPEGHQ